MSKPSYRPQDSHSPVLPTSSLATLLALYLAQGLPSGLFAHALPVFWREAGVALGWIGALKLLALPWVLKALWAPLLDRSLARGTPPGRWIAALQLPSALLLVGLGQIGLAPSGNLLLPAVLLILAINLLMATQDIVTDGLAIRRVPARWRGVANTLQVAGYKTGMLAGGALLLILAGGLGTQVVVLVPAALLIVLFLLIHRAAALRERTSPSQADTGTPPSLREGFIGLVKQPGMVFWLTMVACYKIADALGSGMIRPMLTDGGWTTQAIGTFTLISTLAGLLGAALGGWLYTRLGGRQSLIWAGIAQALTMSAWALVAYRSTDIPLVYGVGMAEQLADGASTVVLFAIMMNLCRQSWAGTDFTIQASLQVVCAGLFGLLGGVLAALVGYAGLLVFSGLCGLMVVLVYAWKTRMIHHNPL